MLLSMTAAESAPISAVALVTPLSQKDFAQRFSATLKFYRRNDRWRERREMRRAGFTNRYRDR
jgi:hypothetical protein